MRIHGFDLIQGCDASERLVRNNSAPDFPQPVRHCHTTDTVTEALDVERNLAPYAILHVTHWLNQLSSCIFFHLLNFNTKKYHQKNTCVLFHFKMEEYQHCGQPCSPSGFFPLDLLRSHSEQWRWFAHDSVWGHFLIYVLSPTFFSHYRSYVFSQQRNGQKVLMGIVEAILACLCDTAFFLPAQAYSRPTYRM